MGREEYNKRKRDEALAKGNCGNCWKEKTIEGEALCQLCKETHHHNVCRKRQERYDAGICVRCGKHPFAPPTKQCNLCLDYTRNWQFNNKDRLKTWQTAYKDRQKELSKVWRAANKDRCIAQGKAWRAANKDKTLRNKYGISLEDYQDLLERQGGKCAICRKQTKMYVDHDHETGKVRGLLCRECNLGIGHFNDSHINLLNAADYLKSNFFSGLP